MLLKDKDFSLLQLSIEAILQQLLREGLSLVIERDFSKLRVFLNESGYLINPTYDPRVSRLGPRDYWLHIKDADGGSVACMGERFFQTEDFLQLVSSGEIWWHDGLTGDNGREAMGFCDVKSFRIVLPRKRIRGLVTHSGSVWIKPEWRKKGISLYLPYISRSLSLRNYNIDFNTGFVRPNLYGTPVPTEIYGYPNVELCFDAYWPPVNGREQLYICYISREECIQQIRNLSANRRYPVPLEVSDTAVPVEDPLPMDAVRTTAHAVN